MILPLPVWNNVLTSTVLKDYWKKSIKYYIRHAGNSKCYLLCFKPFSYLPFCNHTGLLSVPWISQATDSRALALGFPSALKTCASYTFGVKTSFLQVIYWVTLRFYPPLSPLHTHSLSSFPFIISCYFRICFSIAFWCLTYSLSLLSLQFECKLHERSKFLCICWLQEPNV